MEGRSTPGTKIRRGNHDPWRGVPEVSSSRPVRRLSRLLPRGRGRRRPAFTTGHLRKLRLRRGLEGCQDRAGCAGRVLRVRTEFVRPSAAHPPDRRIRWADSACRASTIASCCRPCWRASPWRWRAPGRWCGSPFPSAPSDARRGARHGRAPRTWRRWRWPCASASACPAACDDGCG